MRNKKAGKQVSRRDFLRSAMVAGASAGAGLIYPNNANSQVRVTRRGTPVAIDGRERILSLEYRDRLDEFRQWQAKEGTNDEAPNYTPEELDKDYDFNDWLNAYQGLNPGLWNLTVDEDSRQRFKRFFNSRERKDKRTLVLSYDNPFRFAQYETNPTVRNTFHDLVDAIDFLNSKGIDKMGTYLFKTRGGIVTDYYKETYPMVDPHKPTVPGAFIISNQEIGNYNGTRLNLDSISEYAKRRFQEQDTNKVNSLR